MKTFIILSITLFLTGCFDSGDSHATKTDESVALGKNIFDVNCIGCHGESGVGVVKDWKERMGDGKFPAPPINGTAHAWHHSPKSLLSTINNGGVRLGGWMPGFKDKLNNNEKQGLLDYIYSLWPAELQSKYDARFK